MEQCCQPCKHVVTFAAVPFFCLAAEDGSFVLQSNVGGWKRGGRHSCVIVHDAKLMRGPVLRSWKSGFLGAPKT
jgi:hypothetical protein